MPLKGIARQLAYYLSFDGLGSGGGERLWPHCIEALDVSMTRSGCIMGRI
jgi:hypothetical protein